jgi:hypothetical protein
MKNNILLIIILIEISYIAINYTNLTIFKFKIKQFFGSFHFYKLFILIIISIIFILSTIIISKTLNTSLSLSFLFLFLSLILFIEYKLRVNSNISNKVIDINDSNIINNINTGDLIIFETPKNIDTLFAIIPVLFIDINHIGIIIKDKTNKIYVLECENTKRYCKYSNRIKTGVMLTELEEIFNYFDTSYLIKTNLNNYIKNNELIRFIDKYKDKEYMEDNINCVTFLSLFLKELNLIYDDDNNTNNNIYLDYEYFLNKDIYIHDFNYDIFRINTD